MKPKSTGDALVGVIDRFVNIKEKEVNNEAAQQFTISKCIAALRTLEGFGPAEKPKAFVVFKSVDNREIFLRSIEDNDGSALAWLRGEMAKYHEEQLNKAFQGYLVGNPLTGETIDISYRVPYAHGFGIISDQLYETISGHCRGEDYNSPTNVLCAQALGTFNDLLSQVMTAQILLNRCAYASSRPTEKSGGYARKILSEEAGILKGKQLKNPPPRVPLGCISYTAYLSYYWANDELTREALGIHKGTVDEWVRCQSGNMPFTRDIKSSIKYHRNVTANGYRALVYSGDHDAIVPHLGTQAWVRSLGFPVVDDWRAWHLHGQSAGFTISYANNMTFTTIKGAGHTAPQYEPERCFAMFSRWILDHPL